MNFEKIKQIMLITLKWLLICCLIGIFSGSASALFLVSLEFVTQVRIQNTSSFIDESSIMHIYGEIVNTSNVEVSEGKSNPCQWEVLFIAKNDKGFRVIDTSNSCNINTLVNKALNSFNSRNNR